MDRRAYNPVLIATLLTMCFSLNAQAYDRDDNPPGWRGGPGTNWENPPGRTGGPGATPDRKRYKEYGYQKPRVIHRGHDYKIPANRIRHYRDIVIVRPHGHLYPGYGHFSRDNDAFKWLAFTAITIKLLDNLNEAQQREHEAAQVRATSAPIGETIYWKEGGASGSVTTTREGTSTSGRYCREFQHEVTIGGKKERAYGTACQQQDGSWEIISTGD